MMECRLVLKALPDEADMNFDELERDLHTAQQAARLAYEAASVVHQGARLDPRWGSDWSRPKAIFARHGAAVRDGAPRVDPKPASGDLLERWLWRLPATDSVDGAPEVRPTCTGTVRATKRPCTAAAIYLGSGVFGAHCYSHATPMERDQYRAHHDSVSAQQSTSYTDLLERQRGVGERLSEQWLQHRDNRSKWVDEVRSATRTEQQTP
nr:MULTISPECIES: hypothetical protein [unclassified Mycobacterium]